MSGGNQQSVFEEKKRSIIADLHRQVDEQSPVFISDEERLQQSGSYLNALRTSSDRMSNMGLNVDHLEILANSSMLKESSERQNQISRIADKEASYKLKKSKQEAAAKRRGEYNDYKTDKKLVAASALRMYSKKNEEIEQRRQNGENYSPELSNYDGNEFVETRPEKAKVQTPMDQKITNLMLQRDRLQSAIAKKEADFAVNPTDEVNAIYFEHLKNQVACMTDAIETWFLANGINQKGNAVSERVAKKAKEHLPLALEKYQFMVQNFARIYGRDMWELILSKDKVKASLEETKQQDLAYSEEHNVPVGLSHVDEAAVQKIDDLISSHTEQYEQNKTKIDAAYREMIEEYKRVQQKRNEYLACYEYSGDFTNELYKKTIREGIDAVRTADELTVRQANYHAECAQSYIKYLLTGKLADPLHAPYIKERWKADIEIPDDPVAVTSGIYAEMRTAVQQRMEKLLPAPENETPLMEKHRKYVLSKLSAAATVKDMKDALATADSLKITARQDLLCYTETGEDLPVEKALFGGTGYRDMARALIPGINPTEDDCQQVDRAKLLFHAKVLYTMEDKQRSDPNFIIPEEEQAASVRTALSNYYEGFQQLKDFVATNGNIFREREIWNALEQVKDMDMFAKKSQAYRDFYSKMLGGKTCTLLTPEELETLKVNAATASAYFDSACSFLGLQGALYEKSSKEILAIKDTPQIREHLKGCSFEANYEIRLSEMQNKLQNAMTKYSV